MKKLKINELEEGKIYTFTFEDNLECAFVHRIKNNRLQAECTLGWEDSILSYNSATAGYFTEIQREIDWSKVPRGTKVQVSLTEKGDWFNRYFIDTGKKDGEHAFVASPALDDDFTGYEMEDFSDGWEYCRIHESVEIPDEWYKEVE